LKQHVSCTLSCLYLCYINTIRFHQCPQTDKTCNFPEIRSPSRQQTSWKMRLYSSH
jgi:hypothetical protein